MADKTRTSQSIRAVGLGSGAAAERLVAVLGTARGFTVTATGPNQFHFVRTGRAPWVVPTAVVTGLLSLGLGLLLLLVRRTDELTARIVEDSDGVAVVLDGDLDPDVVAAITIALAARPAPATRRVALDGGQVLITTAPPVRRAAQVTGPSPAAPVVRTAVARGAVTSQWRDEGDSAVGQRRAAGRGVAVLVFTDGREVEVTGGGVIGRNPIDDPEMPGGLRIIDADASLSKTHLSFRPGADGISVRDRASTNGSSAVVGGASVDCPPHVWVAIPWGSTVHIGDVSFRVDAR